MQRPRATQKPSIDSEGAIILDTGSAVIFREQLHSNGRPRLPDLLGHSLTSDSATSLPWVSGGASQRRLSGTKKQQHRTIRMVCATWPRCTPQGVACNAHIKRRSNCFSVRQAVDPRRQHIVWATVLTLG